MSVFSGPGARTGVRSPIFDRITAETAMKNARRRTPLSKFEQKMLNSPTEAVYIYNVSPIWEINRSIKGIGNFLIQRAEWYTLKDGPKVAPGLALLRRFMHPYDRGDGKTDHMIEEPIEIAEDIMFMGKPLSRSVNLVNRGCFLTEKPLEEYSKKEQSDFLVEAAAKHEQFCREKVLQGDEHAADPVMRRNITETARKCALFLGEVENRAWVTLRGPQKDRTQLKECQFCGFEMKQAAVKCPNCKETVDFEGYEALKVGKGKK